MKKMILVVGFLSALAVINAVLDSQRECGCQPECWCKKPGLRHFRWLLPTSHRSIPPEWKQKMESGSPS